MIESRIFISSSIIDSVGRYFDWDTTTDSIVSFILENLESLEIYSRHVSVDTQHTLWT